MKVSIITVSYNSEKTIKDTLDSISRQSYKDIEHIIIDGLSNDDTLNIIKNYDHNINLTSERDKGIYDAMNKGISISTGEIIGILNSDDLYYNEKIIEEIVQEFNKDNQLDIIYGNLLYVKANDTKIIIRKWISKYFYNLYFEDGNVPPHPTLFLKKKIYQEAGLFDIKFKLASDYDFMLRIFKIYAFKSKYINKYLVKMRLGGATNKNFKNIILGNLEIIQSWRKYNLQIPFLFFPKKIIKRLLQFL